MTLLKNVRARLTLWYLLVFTFILVIYAGLAVSLYYFNLRQDLDQELQENYEILENLIEVTPNGSVYFDEDDALFLREAWFEIWSEKGQLLFSSLPVSSKRLPELHPEQFKTGGFQFRSLSLQNNIHLRVMVGKVNIDGHWLLVRLIKNEQPLWRDLHSFILILLLALPFALIIAGLGGYFLSRKLLRPVDHMADSARKIGEQNLHLRLPVVNPDDELGNLAVTFNELLDRLEKSFARLKQFTSDAAHELRTPLTAIRSTGEVSLQENRDSDYYRNVIGSILEENQRLTRLIDSLLFLSRADSDKIKVRKESLPLYLFLEQTIEFIHPLAEEKNQRIELKGARQIKAKADRDLLREAVLNILDNAIKYSPDGSVILVELGQRNDEVFIAIHDQGPGIPPQERDKIFCRFYRLDKARSRAMGGSGLGLAISRWAIKAQGGRITVENGADGGAIFTIILSL